MKLNFRQGIVKAPVNPVLPDFLAYNGGTNSISLTNTTLVRATIAQADANYLIEERNQVSSAWGPLVWNSAWGTDPGTYTFYLYWDVNLASGHVTRGFTPLESTYSTVEPADPATDQHWFDTDAVEMKVWNGTAWVKKARVFAGTWAGGNNITEEDFGTQVGLDFGGDMSTWPDHGYILYSMDLNGVRGADGTFVTTATSVSTNHGNFSSPIRLELMSSTMLAAEIIPALSCVANVGDDTAILASDTDVDKRPIGLTTVDALIGEAVDVVTNGIVYSDQWDWNIALGKDVYCGPTGELVQGPSADVLGAKIRVGTILSPTSILVDVDLYGTIASGPTGLSGYSGTNGASGYSGTNGASGYSGVSTSGYSGFSGAIGSTGSSGYSGVNGVGASGYSGVDAVGTSGYSGVGTSGYSGVDGAVGTSGYSGVGTTGASGYSGVDGAGSSGYSGVDGAVGTSGYSGVDGAVGTSGYSGVGTTGASGYSGIGTSGYSGVAGSNILTSATVGALPAATSTGQIIYVSDANVGVGTVAFANGSIWIDIKTGAAVI